MAAIENNRDFSLSHFSLCNSSIFTSIHKTSEILKSPRLSDGSGRRGSNPRPSAWEADALPTELLPHKILVGAEGVDPLDYSITFNLLLFS